MKGHGTKFGRKKEEAVAALLTQRNIEEAAKTIGIAPNTLLKWMKEPEFDAAYRAARRSAFGQSISRLQQASSAAVSTLLKVMVDASTPASTKVRAADSVLNHSAKAIEIEDIEVRVSALERATEASKGRGTLGGIGDGMRASLRSRLERLEVVVEPKKPQLFRSGYLKTLPTDYVGERHVVIVKREPTGAPGTFEWCEFEERPGQASPGSEDPCFSVYLTENDAIPEQAE